MAERNPGSVFPNHPWEQLNVSFNNFKNDCRDGLYNLNPEHQRGVVHNDAWKAGIIRSACEYNDIPPVRFHTRFLSNGTKQYESLDGKQRCTAVIDFMEDKFRVNFPEWYEEHSDKTFSDLSISEKQYIKNRNIDIKVTHSTLTPKEIALFFQRAQQTKITQLGEHLNSDIGSPKRAISQKCLADERIKTLLNDIKKNPSRYIYLEMIARMLYCYETYSCGESNFDVSPDKLKKWWANEDTEHTYVDEYTFKQNVEQVLDIILESRINYKAKKTTYLPIFWFYLKNPQHISLLKEYISKGIDGDVWNSVVGGKHNTSYSRFVQLEEEILGLE